MLQAESHLHLTVSVGNYNKHLHGRNICAAKYFGIFEIWKTEREKDGAR